MKQELNTALKALRQQVSVAIERNEPLVAVETEELYNAIELAFQFIDNQSKLDGKSGFTIYKADGDAETYESNCFCVCNVEDRESGMTHNYMHNVTNVEILGLIELLGRNRKKLLNRLTEDIKKDIQDMLSELADGDGDEKK